MAPTKFMYFKRLPFNENPNRITRQQQKKKNENDNKNASVMEKTQTILCDFMRVVVEQVEEYFFFFRFFFFGLPHLSFER